MPSTTAQHEKMDLTFRALADPTRRAIMDLLKDGPKTTTQLVSAFPSMTRFGVMKHLGVLEEAELVISRKEGRTRWNHLNAVPLRLIYERWVSTYEDHWAGSLTRLKQTVEQKSESAHTAHKGKKP
ncbi:MAG: ArsR/SmtB family transcription factor [Phycisphaerales bacterium]